MKHVNFKERKKKAVQIVSKRSAVIAQRCRLMDITVLLRWGDRLGISTPSKNIVQFWSHGLMEKYIDHRLAA